MRRINKFKKKQRNHGFLSSKRYNFIPEKGIWLTPSLFTALTHFCIEESKSLLKTNAFLLSSKFLGSVVKACSLLKGIDE